MRSESFYQNLHFPLSETWCESVITLLRVGDRPVVRNSHTGSKAPSAGRVGMCQAPQLVKVQASCLGAPGTISKELAIAYRKKIESQFPFGDQFSPENHLQFGKWVVLNLETLYSSGIKPQRSSYTEGPEEGFLLAASLPPFHVLFSFLWSTYSYNDISLSLEPDGKSFCSSLSPQVLSPQLQKQFCHPQPGLAAVLEGELEFDFRMTTHPQRG